MDTPAWAEVDLSSELPVLRAQGEGPELEYIAEFPQNATELAKEIAAFASTEGGTILLGVDDTGGLQGIPDGDNGKTRDALFRRLEGVCHGQIRPAVTPKAAFALDDGIVVLVIQVPRGEQPLYYCHHRPYVRHLTQARPAEPHEVIERVAQYLTDRLAFGAVALEDEAAARRVEFVSDLASGLRDVLLWSDEAEERQVNPGLRELMLQFGIASAKMRRLAASDMADELGLTHQLTAIGDLCDQVAKHRHTLGQQSWTEFLAKISTAKEAALSLWQAQIATAEIPAESQQRALDAARQASRQLRDLDRRAGQMVQDGRLTELQFDASGFGRRITELSYLGLDRGDSSWVEELRSIGHALHLADMISFTMGGPEVDELLDLVHQSAERLQELLDRP